MLNEISGAGEKQVVIKSRALPRLKMRQEREPKVKTVDRQPKIDHFHHDCVISATTTECSPRSASKHSVFVNNSG
jgi:hypothetical protein